MAFILNNYTHTFREIEVKIMFLRDGYLLSFANRSDSGVESVVMKKK